jgi:DNA repair protein RadC
MDFAQTLETLAKFEGRRALVIENDAAKYVAPIAAHFEKTEALSLALFPLRNNEPAIQNVNRSQWLGGELPYEASTFDAVFLLRALSTRSEWLEILRETMRVLKQRAHLVVAENSAVAATQTQIIVMDLERLMCDRDAVLLNQIAPDVSIEDIRRELRHLELNHLRSVDVPPEDGGVHSPERVALKRNCLERIKLDLLPSLSQLGDHRREFEQRLMDLKRRIEVIGVAPLGLVLMHGTRKTVYATSEGSLFASEILAADAPALPIDEADDVALEGSMETAAPSEIEMLPTPELLSLVISGGESSRRLQKLAKRILREYGSRAVADERNPQKLVENFGISNAYAAQIVATFELGRRFFASDEESPVLRGPEDIYAHTVDMVKMRREQFRALYLDNRQRLVADEVISIGTLTSAILHPREVFRPALTHRAVSVILVHNHPSGDAAPSVEDVEMTRQLADAGKILGIELLDHVIVGTDGWFSMRHMDLI